MASLAQSAQFSVEAVKAAYLFRFAQYVEWPPIAADAPFVIAVSGAEEVAAHLDRLLPGMSSMAIAPWFAASRARRNSTACTSSISAPTPLRARARCAPAAVEHPILVVTEQ